MRAAAAICTLRASAGAALAYALVLFSGPLAMSDAEDARSEQECADYLLLGIESARQGLRRGVFRAAGHIAEKNLPAYEYEGPWDIFCAFDKDKGITRFDSGSPTRMELGGADATPEETRQGFRVVISRNKLILSNAEQSLWTTWTGGVQVQKRDKPLESMVSPLDVGALGLMLQGDLLESLSLEDLLAALRHQTVLRCRQQTPELSEIEWLSGVAPNRAKRRVWINAEQGFTPVHLEFWAEEDGVWKDAPIATSDVEWKLVNDAWVPLSFSFTEGGPDGDRDQYELSFDWTSVNDIVPDRYFTIDDFDLPEGEEVVDYRFGEPVVVRTIGRPADGAAVVVRQPQRRFVWLIVGANAIAVVVAILFAMRRRNAAPP